MVQVYPWYNLLFSFVLVYGNTSTENREKGDGSGHMGDDAACKADRKADGIIDKQNEDWPGSFFCVSCK